MLHDRNLVPLEHHERASPESLHRIVRDIHATFGGYIVNTISGAQIKCPACLYEPNGEQVIFAHELLPRWPVVGLLEDKSDHSGYGFKMVVDGFKSGAFCESSGLFSPSSLFPMRYARTNFVRNSMLKTLNEWLTL